MLVPDTRTHWEQDTEEPVWNNRWPEGHPAFWHVPSMPTVQFCSPTHCAPAANASRLQGHSVVPHGNIARVNRTGCCVVMLRQSSPLAARLPATPSNSSHSSPQHGTCDRFSGESALPNSLCFNNNNNKRGGVRWGGSIARKDKSKDYLSRLR